MAIKKKKPRKKRQPQFEMPPTQEEKDKVQFRDEFQKGIGGRIEELGTRLEGKGRQVTYGVGALVVLLIIAGLFYGWSRRTDNFAKAALADAIRTSQLQVTDSPLPAGVTARTFKTEKARAEAAIKDFEAVVKDYGEPYASKAKYFIAINRVVIDRKAGTKELESLVSSDGDVAMMARYALAQIKAVDGDNKTAEKLYKELSEAANPVIPAETARFELAKLLEKQGKSKEAAALYFRIAKDASELKDRDKKPVPLTQTAREAKERLEELDPKKAKEIKEPTSIPSGL